MTLERVGAGGRVKSRVINRFIDEYEAHAAASALRTLKPTGASATGGGSSATVSANGKVTFTAAATVSIDGWFITDEYDRYRILIDITATSTSLGGGIRLRASGVDAAGAGTYVGRQTYGTSSSYASAAYSTTSFPYAAVSATEHFIVLELLYPALARTTILQELTAAAFVGTTATADTTVNGKHTATSIYDGITLVPSTGTITGTAVCMGYNTGV